jgi:hypothetical protein
MAPRIQSVAVVGATFANRAFRTTLTLDDGRRLRIVDRALVGGRWPVLLGRGATHRVVIAKDGTNYRHKFGAKECRHAAGEEWAVAEQLDDAIAAVRRGSADSRASKDTMTG